MMHAFLLRTIGWMYRSVIKPILFLQDPEVVHNHATKLGEFFGTVQVARTIFSAIFVRHDPLLAQTIQGVDFASPVGMAAGFDYEARLTRILPCIGFGFGTVGTLTHRPYEGNKPPMLGRLPKSKSLMVNKGFKNLGVTITLSKFSHTAFAYPVGVSIGKTNTLDIRTQEEGVRDVVAGFTDAEQSGAPFAYYELNISCPNLQGSVEFYDPEHLRQLLDGLSPLHLSRPVFVKMPISKTNEEITAILTVLARYPYITGIIFGNLQRDRAHATLHPDEVALFPRGNFSGLPCRDRSDECIRLAYGQYGNRFIIIGCGGIFSADDAYRKITLGATLVQLITGLIYEGPQLVAQINAELADRARRDGYTNISQAVGRAHTETTS